MLTASGDDGATRILPTTATLQTEDTVEDGEPQKKKRSPWTWPLIALIVLLLIVLGGTVWALLNQGGTGGDADKTPAQTTTSQAPPVETPKETPTQAPVMVDVSALGLVGLPCDAARQKAIDAGLQAECVPGTTSATSSEQAGTVEKVEPSGNVVEGSAITLITYKDQVPVGKPSGTPTLASTTPVEGEEVTLNWPSFECPSGTSARSSFEVTLTNATFSGGTANESIRSFGPSVLSTKIIPGTAGQSITATYRAFCGDRPSDMSDPMPGVLILPAADGDTSGGTGN
jgi:serine/threonine-protein kinase